MCDICDIYNMKDRPLSPVPDDTDGTAQGPLALTTNVGDGPDDLLLPESFVTTGGRWTDGGGVTTSLGGPGGTLSWSLVGAGVTDVTGEGFFEGESVDMATFIPFDYVATLQRAFDAWSAYGDITFVQVPDGGGDIGAGSDPTIRVVSGFIDGPARTMGQAFFPATNPAGGDIVFDSGDAERFQTEANFFFIALHEIGHAIGLRHSTADTAIMRPTFNPGLGGLQPDDIAGVQAIYGPARATQAVALRDEFDVLRGRFGTIAEAFAAASNGYTIAVRDGYTGGIESVTASARDLTLRLPAGVETIVTLTTENDRDFLLKGEGKAQINGNLADNRLTGSSGDDRLFGFGRDDALKGLDGNDTIYGGDGSGVGSGNDTISGRDGADSLFGEDGNDLIYGGDGNDSVDGGAGRNSIIGGRGEDTLRGGNERDVIYGEDGDDLIIANAGNDFVRGGFGNDTLNGNDGEDIMSGQAGDDVLYGGGDRDLLIGGFGDDFIAGDGGADNIFGGADADTIEGGEGNDIIRGEGQDDLLSGDAGNDTVTGGGGRDTLNGGGDDDALFAQGGQDALRGDGGDDSLYGGDGPDILFGGSGNDLLIGGNDADTLDGGTGDDEMRGNAGADTFVFGDGYDADAIISFQSGTDRIELRSDVLIGTGASTVAQVLDPGNGIAAQTSSRLVTLDFGGGDILTIGSGTAFSLADLADGMTIL